jgi:hypothetical protein
MANSRVVLTPEVRLSFANLIKPTEWVDPKTKNPSGKWSYNTEIIIPEDAVKKFRVLRDGNLVEVDLSLLLRELALEKWPELAQPGALQAAFAGVLAKGWPLKRGDVKADALKAAGKNGEHYRGGRVMTTKSNVNDKVQPPALSILNPDKKTFRSLNRMLPSDMETAKMAFVGGNFAVAELNIVASEVSGLKYLSAYLNSVRYTREGAKFGGQGGQLMSRFEGIVGGESPHDPTAGMDAEIPF